MTQPEPKLKLYEREILRARSRVQVADLDREIDDLIALLVGKLTKSEHKIFQASRISEFMTFSPEAIIARRAILLDLTEAQIKRLTAPDILTMEEVASLVIIMRTIANWLKEYRDAGEFSITLDELIDKANSIAFEARQEFIAIYHREPNIDDVPESIMLLPRARKIVGVAKRLGTLLPPSESEQ